mgnify:CR=1 FL=1
MQQAEAALQGSAGARSLVVSGMGTGSTRELSAGLGGALVDDRVLFRVAGLSKHSDGTLTNTYLGRKVDGVDRDDNLRAKLLIRASDDVQIDLQPVLALDHLGELADSLVSGFSKAAARDHFRGEEVETSGNLIQLITLGRQLHSAVR